VNDRWLILDAFQSGRKLPAIGRGVLNGKRVYLADGCFECHGRAGQGGAMNYQTPALARLELPVESFVAFLRAAPNGMPAFSAAVLSDKDAIDIYAFYLCIPAVAPGTSTGEKLSAVKPVRTRQRRQPRMAPTIRVFQICSIALDRSGLVSADGVRSLGQKLSKPGILLTQPTNFVVAVAATTRRLILS
jgi:cytochrome c553